MARRSTFMRTVDKVANLLGAVLILGPILLIGTSPGRDLLDLIFTSDFERKSQCDSPTYTSGPRHVTYTFDVDVSPASVDALVAALENGASRIELASRGGSLMDAIRAYEAIRQAGASTAAIGQCASACSLIFLAGQERCLGFGGKIGVHQWQSDSGFSPDSDSQEISATLIDLINSAGVSQEFFIAGANTPASSMYWLSSDDLWNWNVVSE